MAAMKQSVQTRWLFILIVVALAVVAFIPVAKFGYDTTLLLAQLGADFILVHGLDDDIIPYTESVSLAAALPPGKAKLFLLDGLHHVDRYFHGKDVWRTWRALQAVLEQRD